VIIEQPVFLFGLLAIPILIAGYLVAQLRRRTYVVRFTNLELLRSVLPRSPGIRRHLPPAMFVSGAIALLTGLAVPVLNLEIAKNSADVVLAIDVSGSMQATDVTPTRLDAAKKAAITLIDQLPAADRIALISFNSTATVRQGLTTDRAALKAALSGLRPGGGTALGTALSLALAQLDPGSRTASGARTRPAMIVILTDGVSNQGVPPLTVTPNIVAAKVPVQAIGVGLRNGSATVGGEPVGGVDEATLSAIASATGGKYYYAQAAGELQSIYSALASQVGWQFLQVNLMVPLLIGGISLVMLGAAVSLLWFRVLP
jgi:Ca-activated chloride channel family protein